MVRRSSPRRRSTYANGAGNDAGHSFGPFDGDDTDGGQILIEADLVEIGAIEPIQIDVDERQPSTAIL